VLVITSAGCNALDYAICGPNHVHAVDMNPRQNALLDLKKAGIQHLEYEDFFQFFGQGYHPNARKIFQDKLRTGMPQWSRHYWDRWIKFFCDKNRSFYFRGTSGQFARAIKIYTDRVIRVRPLSMPRRSRNNAKSTTSN
jgi:S-adenosylmethionine-diacylglycerol 3-amino-3-carboxypropyl transferase